MSARIPIRGAVLLALALAVAACGRDAGDAPSVLAPVEQGDGRLEWTVMQPCADCDGIETRLALVREGRTRSFVLTETYLAERPVRFVSSGRWEREDDLLALQADDGARLSYALLGDGSLQPRDGRGRRLAGNDADGLLVPVTSSPRR
jgi:uncharacterized lipoprotein NlpE involved in copper resistance